MHIIVIIIILRIVGRMSGNVYGIIPGLLIYESPLVQILPGMISSGRTILFRRSPSPPQISVASNLANSAKHNKCLVFLGTRPETAAPSRLEVAAAKGGSAGDHTWQDRKCNAKGEERVTAHFYFKFEEIELCTKGHNLAMGSLAAGECHTAVELDCGSSASQKRFCEDGAVYI